MVICHPSLITGNGTIWGCANGLFAQQKRAKGRLQACVFDEISFP